VISAVANPVPAAPAPSPEQQPSILLDELQVGERATIVWLKEESAFLYLLRLGLIVGAEVELVRRVSRGRIKVFRVDSGELALRSESAQGIRVRRVAL
jgi:Fe2+ transport system protein FeoA